MSANIRVMSRLYDLPAVYDLLSPWPIEYEVAGWLDIDRQYRGRLPASVLDPSCGSGRILDAFAGRGIESVGMDLSPTMVAYCAERFRNLPLARATSGDMRNFDLRRTFDLAVQPVNSFRLLTSDADIRTHLACMRKHLPDGVYIIELWLQGASGSVRFSGQEWSERRGDVSASVWYGIESIDTAARRVYERARIDFQMCDRAGHVDEVTEMRLWRADELERFITEQGDFRLVEWRDASFAPLSVAQLRAGTVQTYAVLLSR